MSKIAIVIPTIRPESILAFQEAWGALFVKHRPEIIIVDDTEDTPQVIHNGEKKELQSDLVSNKCAGVRQLGFLYIAKHLPDIEYIFTTDDDCFPIGDPIQDHIDQLNRKVPISWLSTATDYMRGQPYNIRNEAEVKFSHGIWTGVYDWDAPSQLLKGDTKVEFYKGVIPKGIFTSICGMNICFHRSALKYVYFSPVGQFPGAERWDDIWMGIMLIKDFARENWAIVSGYAEVKHLRASDVFTSLEKEAVGLKHNELFWKNPEGYDGHPFFQEFREKRQRWYNLVVESEKL